MRSRYWFDLAVARNIAQKKQLTLSYIEGQVYKLESEEHFMVADISLEVIGIVFEQGIVDIAPVVVVVHTTVFSCIAVITNLIDCNSPVDYVSFVIEKVAIEAMIVLVAWEVAVQGEGFGLVVPLVH